jgi:hypothetical protein
VARKRYYTPDDPDGVTPSRLRRLGRAAQLEYMEAWFREYYEEPENDAPYSEGEYHFVWGGPYDPYDELWNEFGGIVPEDRIQELANKLRLEWVEWAPSALKQQELGAADEALAFPMWPSEPRATARGSGLGSPAGGTAQADIGEAHAEHQPPNKPNFLATAYSGIENLAASTIEQRPAAYRFRSNGGKIDVVPEHPEPEDREFALDTYTELVAKVRELHERLRGTNSARRICDSIERLLVSLGTSFDGLRPGVLLSRSRDIEADRVAFSDELFPDILAMMDGTARTLRDLLASFPLVRRIEAEVVALELDRNADAVPVIQEQMDAIAASAAASGAVTEEALGALARNDAAIEDATDPVVRRSLVGDKLLVFRNFTGAVITGIAGYGRIAGTELGELAGKSWEETKNQLPKSIGSTTALVPPFALVGLAVWLSDPVTAVAVAVASFKPMAQILKHFARDQKPSTAKKHPKRGKSC